MLPWDVTDNVLKSINQKLHVGEIFCDLAFGCVNNEILLAKLHFSGIRGVSEDRDGAYLN